MIYEVTSKEEQESNILGRNGGEIICRWLSCSNIVGHCWDEHQKEENKKEDFFLGKTEEPSGKGKKKTKK